MEWNKDLRIFYLVILCFWKDKRKEWNVRQENVISFEQEINIKYVLDRKKGEIIGILFNFRA